MDKSTLAVPITHPQEPPVPERTVLRIGLIGFGISFLVGLVGMIVDYAINDTWKKPGFDPMSHSMLDVARVVLAVLGVFITGCAVSMRPTWIPIWLVGAGSSFGAVYGLPPQWDSYQLFFSVTMGISLSAAFLLWLPVRGRVLAGGVLIMWHFCGILSAVTSPPPQPWISQQVWTRVFRPYLMFLYMNNAYQFYSPDPGPARELWFCITYTPKKDKDGNSKYPEKPTDGEKGYFRWVKMPLRPQNFVDPLGQAYFRRLAIAEQVASFFAPGHIMNPREQDIVRQRRNLRSDIPEFNDILARQYEPPSVPVQRLYLSSYCRHVAWAFAHPDFDVKSVKFYRVTHQITPVLRFVGVGEEQPMSPYDPSTYLPYFQGEYDREGKPLAGDDPMLFWLLPIVRKPGVQVKEGFSVRDRDTNPKAYLEEFQRCYADYVTIHAGFDHQKGGNLP